MVTPMVGPVKNRAQAVGGHQGNSPGITDSDVQEYDTRSEGNSMGKAECHKSDHTLQVNKAQCRTNVLFINSSP